MINDIQVGCEALKQFIRYLYEYGQGKRIRNVGFVKTEQDNRESTIHIHGKGLRLSRGDSLKVYLIFEVNGQIFGAMQGEIAYMGPSINYRLNYTREDMGTVENYDNICGILLENKDARKFAALWEETPVDVENMRPFVNRGEGSGEVEKRESAGAIPDTAVHNEENVEEEEILMENAEVEAVPEKDVLEVVDTNKEELLEPVSDRITAESAEPDMDVQGQEENGSSISLIKVTKIKRNEIARLPRCEWRLANNNFLLHGYNNYRYLALLDDGSALRLGVPGIYHEKEARAAAGLGFPEFIGADEMVLADSDECADEPRFGFWCRQVRRPVRGQA